MCALFRSVADPVFPLCEPTLNEIANFNFTCVDNACFFSGVSCMESMFQKYLAKYFYFLFFLGQSDKTSDDFAFS